MFIIDGDRRVPLQPVPETTVAAQRSGLDFCLMGDCRDSMRRLIADGVKVQCCVTSPPYFGLRDYGTPGQLGLEQTPAEYVANLVGVFRLVRELLAEDGVLFLNLGDSYANDGKWGGSSGGKHAAALHGNTGIGRAKVTTGLKPKDLIGIPWRVAFALQEDGWYLRQDIIWHKPNPMPESVKDRCTKAHEYIFLLTKSARYYFDSEAMKEPCQTDPKENYLARARITGRGDQGAAAVRGNDRGKSGGFPVSDGMRNKRSVWSVTTKPFTGWKETVRWVRVEPGAASDGMRRIASGDCPVHGRPGPLCGGHGDSAWSHSACTGGCLGTVPGSLPCTSSLNLFESSVQSSSGCLGLVCAPTAISHSRQTSRTGLFPETSVSCTPYVQTESRIASKPEQRELCLQDRGSAGSSIFGDGFSGNPDSQNQCRIAGMYSEQGVSLAQYEEALGLGCTCEVYRRVTEKTTHFACFPEDLITPCILAGSRPGDTVFDPFLGSGTTAMVAKKHGRHWLGCELNPEYGALQQQRLERMK